MENFNLSVFFSENMRRDLEYFMLQQFSNFDLSLRMYVTECYSSTFYCASVPMTDIDLSGSSSSGPDTISGQEGAIVGATFCETDSIFSRLPPEVFGKCLLQTLIFIELKLI